MSMKESNTRHIKIIYRGNPSPDKNRTNQTDKKGQGERLKQVSLSYEDGLDFRDEIVRIPLSFTVLKQVFVKHPASYEEPMLQWLVGVVERIFSIAFRHLLEEHLTLEEAKAWACKNLLGNIKSLCEHLEEVGVGVDAKFLQQLDGFLRQIIQVVIVKYPQNNAKAGSRKVLRFIKQISDRDNDIYDFLRTHNFNLKYRTNADYSIEIMKFVNALLNVPIDPIKEDESLMENFTRFCKQLFYYAHQGDLNQDIRESATFKIVDESVDAVLSAATSNPTQKILGTTYRASPTVEQLDNIIHRNQTEAYRDLATALIAQSYENSEDVANFEKIKGHLFKIGQKIPSQVRQFSQKEVKEGQFKVYHSAVLRVLTKWSQELYQKLQKAGDLIRARIHKFKTNDGLRFCSVQQKEYLYEQAVRQKARVDEYLQTLKNQSKILQSVFAGEHVDGKFIRRFTNIDVFAGKLQELVASHTFHYLNRLIHSLLSLPIGAGQRLYEYYKYLQNDESAALRYLKDLGEVNMVTFKIGDLMRARYACQQHEFVAVLGMLYKMEELDSNFLRIVKINNRMFQKDNDILINFFFRNKIICELQLSIHKEFNRKERLYGDFNHFIYELKRSEFGIFAQFASIVAQHDPIVNYFTFNQHTPPILIQKIRKPSQYLRSRSKQLFLRRKFTEGYTTHRLYERAIERPFICTRCRQLKTVQNPKFYYRDENELVCNECIEAELYKDPYDHKNILKQLFKYYVLDDQLELFIGQVSLWNPADGLRGVRDEKQLYAAFIDFGFIIEKGAKVPRVRFFKTFYDSMNNLVVLSTVANGEIDNFLSIDCKREKGQPIYLGVLSHFLFFLPKIINPSELQQLKTFISEQNCQQDYLATVRLRERQFLKKQYLHTILNSFEKYHSTLYLNGYKYIIEYIYEYLHCQNEAQALKRRNLFQNSALHITSILLQSAQIFTLYPFLKYFSNLKELNISYNHISSLHQLQGFKQLQSLNISYNHITSLQPLSKMPWIDTLIAKNNQIDSLKDIALIHSLRVLYCCDNRLTSIKQLAELKNLEQLTLNRNKISCLDGLAGLLKLRTFYINQNGLNKLQFVDSLTHLQILEASTNYIHQMIQLPRLNKLSKLDLSKNMIILIVELGTKALKQLNLSQNSIKKMENLSSFNELTVLNLAGNQIDHIQGLEGLQKLKRLFLNDNSIDSIQNLDQLKGLQHLKIENNPIKSLKNLSYLKNLASLSFQHCEIKEIAELKILKRLKSLSLAYNCIQRIRDIDQLVRLQRLDLAHNSIKRIQNLFTLKYLQNLSLAHNSISKMENVSALLDVNWLILSNNCISVIEGIEDLIQLRTLQLDGNQIQKITGLDSLDVLEQLMLSSNKIKTISGLDSLINLKKISLANNKIEKMEGLESLARLQLLDLQMNEISKLEGLESLAQLKWLVLSYNRIQSVEGLQKLQQLSKLILTGNRITRIQKIVHLKVLSALYLDGNNITRIQNLEELQNLEKLHLGNNKIQVIEGLDGLEQLTELNLESNRIAIIDGLSLLLKLKKLILSNNAIKAIENLQNLQKLTHLSLSNNQIEAVSALHSLTYLQYVDLTENPIIDAQGYNQLNENVKLCIQLIMQKFDSENLRKTPHNHSLIDKKEEAANDVVNEVKMVRSFAKSFRPQL